MAAIPTARLARMRLAAQRLTPQTAAANAAEAARAVIGIQAQDVRASGIALRSRVPGIARRDIDSDPALVRTWTVRGTVHLLAAADLPWVHALTGPRNQRRFDALMAKRGNLETARSILPALLSNLEDGPLSRADLLARLTEQGHPSLGPHSVNIAMPWAAAGGRLIGLPDGRFRATDPPPPVDTDEALATLGRRYLEGYGPAGAPDLARWSGLPLSQARRALDACEGTERHGDLVRSRRRPRRRAPARAGCAPAGRLRHLHARLAHARAARGRRRRRQRPARWRRRPRCRDGTRPRHRHVAPGGLRQAPPSDN